MFDIPIEFYQACWETIKDDLLSMFSEFYEHKLDLGQLNYGIIILLPKLKDANKIQQYRPICLLNVDYKIFTKALALRVERIFCKIINKCQTTFLKGRNIMESVFVFMKCFMILR